MASLRERAEELRKKLVSEIPDSYKPWQHLAGTTGVGASALAISMLGLKALRPVELLVIPATLAVANAFEWKVHKDVLHKRFWPFEEIFERHTPTHHGVYHSHNMAMLDYREMKLVLIPAVGVLGIVLTAAPAAAALGAVTTSNVAWLFLATSASYMVSYELLHLAYHLPDDHPVAQNPVIQWLRQHHATHHDPKLMQKWNFNVTLPLWDWVQGTIAPESARVNDEEAAMATSAAG